MMTAMTARQTKLVQESFESLGENPEPVVRLFYGRLFDLEPQARILFRDDLREQSRKLLETLAMAVDAAGRFAQLRPALIEMGLRHVAYGAQPAHYEVLRSALLWTLGQALGPEFDRETRAAWGHLLEMICDAMLTGAAQAAPGNASTTTTVIMPPGVRRLS